MHQPVVAVPAWLDARYHLGNNADVDGPLATGAVYGMPPELDDEPIALVPTPELTHAPEAAGTARHLLDPAKAAAVEWRELDRHLVQLTVEQRREVLAVVRRMRGVA